MNYQPIPRLGLRVYPEGKTINEQTILQFIRTFAQRKKKQKATVAINQRSRIGKMIRKY